MGDPQIRCRECNIPTDVEENLEGNMTCTACGLVLEHHIVDASAEWRTFATNESGSEDPSRVGDRSNHLLSDGGLLSTVISTRGARGDDTTTKSLGPRQHRAMLNNPDKTLLAAFQDIANMADRLELVTTIKDRANDIYKKALDFNSSRRKTFGRKSRDAVLAACLYLACAHQGHPRTYKEIQTIANGASLKDITRTASKIHKNMDEVEGDRLVNMAPHPKLFVTRFCSYLKVRRTTVNAILQAVDKLSLINVSNNKHSLTSAVIYMLVTISGEQKTKTEIAAVSGVAESTIESAYRNLYPHAAQLVPEWFLREHKYSLNNLPAR